MENGVYQQIEDHIDQAREHMQRCKRLMEEALDMLKLQSFDDWTIQTTIDSMRYKASIALDEIEHHNFVKNQP